MDARKISSIQKRLEDEKKQMLQQLEELERPENYGADTEDEAEEADEAEEFVSDLAKAQKLRERIGEIDTVLFKIQNGSYGKCKKCGSPIPEGDLEKVPETILCPRCRKT